MRLRITLAYPTEEVKDLVNFASKGINHRRLTVWVKNSAYSWYGRAYLNRGHCVVRIGKENHFPVKNHQYPRLKRPPIYDINNWQEALVLCVAHELRHQQQWRKNKPRSEVDAERWAYKKLLAYRATF